MLVGGNHGGWLVARRGLGRSGDQEGVETLPEASSWPRVFICHPQSPIPLPGQVPPALAERAAGRTSHRPVLTLVLTPTQGQKPYGATLSLLGPPVKYLDRWTEGYPFL